MSQMIDPFPEKANYLLEQGWKNKTPMAFVKNGIELFFDNSTAVEVYRDGDYDDRLDDLQLITITDLKEVLNKIENGKYHMY